MKSVGYIIFSLLSMADATPEGIKADKREVIGLGIELDDEGKGLLDWEKA